MQKKEEFDSTAEGIGYISLDQATLEARRLAREDQERYCQRLGWEEIVWTELESELREDSYRVVLQFRPPVHGAREQQTGQEEFIFDLTGNLTYRQVLAWPRSSSHLPQISLPSSGQLTGKLWKKGKAAAGEVAKTVQRRTRKTP